MADVADVAPEDIKGVFIPETPYTPASQVLAPYAFARTCMFSATRFSGDLAVRPKFSKSSLPLHDKRGIRVQQTAGLRLDKQDEDVALELMRRAILVSLPGDREVWVHVDRAELIKAMGWTRGGSSYLALEASLQGLTDAQFLILAPGEGGAVRKMDTKICLKRVTHITQQGPSRTKVAYEILLDVELFELLRFNQWCYLDPTVRARLSKAPVAKLLHSYFSSYSVGRWLDLDELREMSDRDELKGVKRGREAVLRKEERDGRFRAKVQKNIDTLRQVDPRWNLRLSVADGRVYCDTKPGKKGTVEDVKTKVKEQKSSKSGASLKQSNTAPAATWDMHTSTAELRTMGLKAFVASGKDGFEPLRFNLTSLEEAEFAELLAARGKLSARMKLEALYDFLLESRASRAEDDSDI